MKKIFIVILLLSPFLKCISQNIGINATGAIPHPSAMLDVSATTKGMLVPRMSTAQRTAIPSPAKGLLVFDNDVNSFWFFNGTAWTEFSAGSTTNFWTPNGTDISNINSGKVGIGTTTPISKLGIQTPTGNYGFTHTDGTVTVGSYVNSSFGWLGTKSNHPLTFFTNDGGPSVTLATNGNFGAGTTTPDYKLSIASTTIASNTNTNLLRLRGQNPLMVFSDATTDFGYIKAWSYQPYAPFTKGLVIGSAPGYPIFFSTNNYSLSMIVADNGNVGISTATPSNKLQIGSAPYGGYDFAIGDKNNVHNGMAFLIGDNKTKWEAAGDILIKAGNITGTPHVGIGVLSASNKFQIGSMGATGYIDNDLAIGNGTNATGFLQGNSFLQIASSTNIALMPQLNGHGRVGINTTNPRAPLDVVDNVGVPTPNQYAAWAYYTLGFNNFNPVDLEGGASGYTIPNVSIIASNRILATEFDAYSDARIKDIIGITNSAKDLTTLNELHITDYTMKDKAKYGSSLFKKVIAQDVEKVYPQVVSKHTDFVPNVYQLASKVVKTGKYYELSFVNKHNISDSATKLRVLLPLEGMKEISIVSIPSKTTVIVNADEIKSDKIFVYGEEVNDLRTVNYEGLTTLNISATQELSKLVEEQNKKIAAMERELRDLRKKKD